MRPIKLVAAGATALLVALAIPASAGAAAPTGKYVALGDSYSSGPLIPSQVDLNCTRSDHNYPHLVRNAVGSSAFSDVSCGGATTVDIMNPSNGELGIAIPAQIAAVTPDTALVTVGIGGNDIGFSSIISTCVSASYSNPFGSPCKNQFTAGGVDQLRGRINAAAPKVAAVLDAIHVAAPGARVVVVGYPAILPDSGFGCFPVQPIAFGDVPYLRSTEKSLNSMLANTASAHGASYVDTYGPTVAHDICKSSSVRWIEGLIPTNSAAPFHPNVSGEQAMASAVLSRL